MNDQDLCELIDNDDFLYNCDDWQDDQVPRFLDFSKLSEFLGE